MLRFTLNLALLVALIAWISTREGLVQLSLGTYQIETSTAVAIALLVVTMLLLWFVAKLWFWLKYGWARRRERRLRLRQQQGLQALTQTFSALAGNDLRAAGKAQHRAAKLLGAVPLVTWLGAELASRRGDEPAAARAYQALTHDNTGALLGWRGLLKNKNSTAPNTTLLALTDQALSQKHLAKQEFVHETRLRALAQAGDWAGAVLALHSAESARALPKDRARRLGAVIEIMYAESLKHTDPAKAKSVLLAAHKRAPDFLPASQACTRLLLQQGDKEQALKVLKGAWTVAPHPELFALFLALYPHESALQRLQLFEAFALKRKDSAITHLALAQLAEAAGISGKANSHKEQAQKIAPHVTLQSSNWQNSLWRCHACHTPHTSWDALCLHCGALGEITAETAG